MSFGQIRQGTRVPRGDVTGVGPAHLWVVGLSWMLDCWPRSVSPLPAVGLTAPCRLLTTQEEVVSDPGPRSGPGPGPVEGRAEGQRLRRLCLLNFQGQPSLHFVP